MSAPQRVAPTCGVPYPHALAAACVSDPAVRIELFRRGTFAGRPVDEQTIDAVDRIIAERHRANRERGAAA